MTEIEIVERLMAVHGGRDAWSDVTAISARLSTGGLAYLSRFRFGALRSKEVAVRLDERRVSILDFPRCGWWGEWHDDRVSIGPDGGPPAHARADARERFKGWLAHPRWDDLDHLYFVGYALWNYLSFPRLLDLPSVDVRLVRGGRMGQPALLAARFPDDIPTHCRRQYFHLDADGLLRRHDYGPRSLAPGRPGPTTAFVTRRSTDFGCTRGVASCRRWVVGPRCPSPRWSGSIWTR